MCRCSKKKNNHNTQIRVMVSVQLPVSVSSRFLWTEQCVCVFAALHVCVHVSVSTCTKESTKQHYPRVPGVKGSVRTILCCCRAHTVVLKTTHAFSSELLVCLQTCDIALTLTALCTVFAVPLFLHVLCFLSL